MPTVICLTEFGFVVEGGRPVARNVARKRLLDDLDRFVRGRLVLALLPVKARLYEDGATNLAEVVELAVRDIHTNLARILSSYQIGVKDE